ncbi:uncharacterized protein LOC111832367 [Capsella rubella]|uniref:uncharacterized protein LOC111832367 n=1 Tax=Capsella rubella TaxID=81985 RepID=UPI000CD4D576|nr:uncharacterized protein LOC111832367 [Capsella rubella]
MGKRKTNSKYRSSTPDLPENDSPISHDKTRSSSPSRNALGSAYPVSNARFKSSTPHFEISNSPDNIHSPFHLHSSDHPGLVLVPDLLDGTNYGTWIVAITTSIEAKNKLGFVDGSLVRPDESDPYFLIWKRCNSMVKSWLLNSVSKQIYSSILYFSTAAEIWKDLYTRYHKSNLPRLYKLRQQIHSLRQGSMDLSSYHTKTQALWEELSSLQVTARSVEDLLAERETNRVIDFLMGLNNNYDTVRSQILMKKSLPSLSEVYNMLDQDDSQRSACLPQTATLDSTAFQVSQQTSQSTSSGGYQKKDKHVCTFCGRIGHVMDKCYKKNGYPVGHPRFKFSQSAPTAANVTSECSSAAPAGLDNVKVNDDLSPEQMQQIVSFLNTRIHSSTITPEVHAVSVSSLPSSSLTTGPAPGSFSGLNDWVG